MKTIISYLLFLGINMCSLDVPQINDIEHIIRKNNPMWVDSWVHNPLLNLSFGSCWHSNDAYSWNYSKDDPKYECFYNYSPSKTRFVDIYSHPMDVYIIENDSAILDIMDVYVNKEDTTVHLNKNDTVIIYLQHESEIILSDTIAKISERLLYVGNGIYFEDVIWITNNSFIVLGRCYDYKNDKLTPLIIIFDIYRKKHLYCNGIKNKRKYDYVDEKFSERKFKIIK